MKRFNYILIIVFLCAFFGACSHQKAIDDVTPEQAAKIDRKLVRETVVFEQGTRDGAVVPDLSAPRLRAVWVAEKIESNRLIEAHREWLLEGDMSILGISSERKSK